MHFKKAVGSPSIPRQSVDNSLFVRPLIRLRELLARPTDALPLDLFRVLVGLVVFAYFLQTFLEARDISGPDGLIDHELSEKIFWFTRIGFFQPGLGLRFFQTIFLIACLGSWAVVLGYRVKLFAALLYLIAVSTYRWNFLVMYVDDSIMHLALFWLLLLPVGRTLLLSEWMADRQGSWQRWTREKVPGVAVRCLMWNLSLIYLVAGLWKWTSPMWRNGTALYAIFKLPVISLSPDFWGPQHLPVLKLLNYATLILEPLFPLIFILPRGHRAKYALLLALLGFHVGTLMTLRIPFANLACCAVLVIPFGGELMYRIRRGRTQPSAPRSPPRLEFAGAVAVVVVAVLTLAMVSSVTLPQWRAPSRRLQGNALSSQNTLALSMVGNSAAPGGGVDKFNDEGLGTLQWTFYSALWCVGLAQQYQLFNWIDDRNYSLHYEVIESPGGESGAIFPRSTRGALLQFYVHGLTWMRIPRERQAELRSSLQVRMAGRYCRQFQPSGAVAVYSTLERIIPGANRVEENRVLLMKFSCQASEPVMQVMNLDP